MDARIRKAVSKIAAALEFFVDDIDPRSVFMVGNTPYVQEHSDWIKNRRIHHHQARHVWKQFARLAFQPMMISPERIPVGTESPEWEVTHRYSFAVHIYQFEWFANLAEVSVPAVLIERLLNAANAFDELGLDESPLAAEIDPASLDAIRQVAKELHDLAMFVPSELQAEILDALNGKAMTFRGLLAELLVGSAATLNGKNGTGGIKELMALGLLCNNQKVGGYFRPDAPPRKSVTKA